MHPRGRFKIFVWVVCGLGILVVTQGSAGPGHESEDDKGADLRSESEVTQDWVQILTDRSLTQLRTDQALDYLKNWRALATASFGQTDLQKDQENKDKFFSSLGRWVGSLSAEQRKQAEAKISSIEVSGTQVDPLLKSSLLAMIAHLRGTASVAGSENENSQAAAAQRASEKTKKFNEAWNKTLNEAVSGSPAKFDPKKNVSYSDWEGGSHTGTAKDWAEKQVKDYGFDNLVRWAYSIGGDSGEKMLTLLASHQSEDGKPQGFGLVGRNVDKNPAKLSTPSGEVPLENEKPFFLGIGSEGGDRPLHQHFAKQLAANHGAWEQGEFLPASEVRSKTPTSVSSVANLGGHHGSSPPTHSTPSQTTYPGQLTERQKALEKPEIQPILDKCISCHAMEPPDSPAAKLVTRETLKHAMRKGRDVEFTQLILDMFSKGDYRHIHFLDEEMDAIRAIYGKTQGDDDEIEKIKAPEPVEPMSAAETKLSQDTPRAKRLASDPVLKAAMYRCLTCHKDPAVKGTSHVNTMSELRIAMRSMDKTTLDAMLEKAYDTKNFPRYIHIQNVKDRPEKKVGPDGKITTFRREHKLEDALENFIKLQPDP